MNEKEQEIIISIETENGKKNYAVICSFEIDGNNYIALMPLINNTDHDQEIQLFRYTESDNTEYEGIEIHTIDDDTEFEKALEIFDKLMSDND